MDPNFDPYQVHVGEDEVIILQAISSFELSNIAYSETFQGDILEYDAFTNKIGVSVDIRNGNDISGGLSPSTIVSGFDIQWDGTNVYFNMPAETPALFGHYFYLYAEFSGGSYYQDGAFEPLTPGISNCQYPFTSDDPEFNYGKAMSRLKVSSDGIKVILLDLTEDDFNNYDVDTLKVETVKAIADCYGWVTRRTERYKNISVPFDFRSQTYRRFEVDIKGGLGDLKYASIGGYFGSEQTTGLYKDSKSINTEGYDFYNIYIDGTGGPDDYTWYRGTCYNNVIGRDNYDTSIYGVFNNNTMEGGIKRSRFYGGTSDNYKGADNFYDNIVTDFNYNICVGGAFSSNILKSFASNRCYGPFSGNNIEFASSNTFSDNVYNNKINILNGNTIGANFVNNTISSMNNNTIGNGFIGNVIDGSLSSNIIDSNFNNNIVLTPGIDNTDFRSATHVYAQYTCTIFENSAFAYKLYYINGGGSLVVVNPNA